MPAGKRHNKNNHSALSSTHHMPPCAAEEMVYETAEALAGLEFPALMLLAVSLAFGARPAGAAIGTLLSGSTLTYAWLVCNTGRRR